MNNHTTAQVGKRIHIILKSGRQFVDKLTEIKGRHYEFEREGRIKCGDIRSFSLNKLQSGRQG